MIALTVKYLALKKFKMFCDCSYFILDNTMKRLECRSNCCY